MRKIVDGNEAVAMVAHRLSEVIAIYPITPASTMAEWCDEWSALGQQNLWGAVPKVVELQSEAGAAGTVHGALQAGSLATTFTASQGLLLMIPNLYKIAGELTPFVLHVAARTVATHALSIFGDHSDVMACRQTGMAMLCAGSVQEAYDFAVLSHLATLKARLPFLHFFDGFRTSHEVLTIHTLSDEDLLALVDEQAILAHRQRALSPDQPVIRGTAHNPDTFFQAREACNPYYLACPGIVEETMARFFERSGRRYRLFDYVGHPEAERVLVLMGSGAEAAHETVDWLAKKGERVGVLKVRLYRPWDHQAFLRALPKTVRSLSVLDRTKEPGAPGDPLYLDVLTTLMEAQAAGALPFAKLPTVVNGRYGISSKEFTPAMILSIFDHLKGDRPRNHYSVGIVDDVTHQSLPWDNALEIEPKEVTRALFYGLGSDGSVGMSKNIIKIVGSETEMQAQGYFVYDSKKSGSTTISHLRFSPQPIRSTYKIGQASFVGVSQPQLVERLDVLAQIAKGGTFLLNSPVAPEQAYERLPQEIIDQIREKELRFFVIDAHQVAQEVGLKGHVSTVMQACFFALAGVLPTEQAIEAAKRAVQKTFGRRGDEIVRRNILALETAISRLKQVPPPGPVKSDRRRPPPVPKEAPDFVQRVTAAMIAGHGDALPVSAFPVDGTWPVGTTQWEKRNIALEVPIWDEKICIQCNKCALVCPHAAIRAKVYDPGELKAAPEGFRSMLWKGSEHKGQSYTIQLAPEDCTGCGLCVVICPAKDKANPRHKAIDMEPVDAHRERERQAFAFFDRLPPVKRELVHLDLKGSQLLEPLFEFSGACSGCGETPYVKLLSQLFGDRALIANATGCSSIYGGNQPTTPWKADREGRGPAWANSLFEDNAEFGLGFRLAQDAAVVRARLLLTRLGAQLPSQLVDGLLQAEQTDEAQIAAQRQRVVALRQALAKLDGPEVRRLMQDADALVKKSVWIVGGDGWAYDIGFGGLDHVLASDADVNILVLDTEVYSNTGGQQSKATPIGASAKFAAAGKAIGKKDLGLIAMSYGHVYVAQVAMYAKDASAIKAFIEAESYPGPSLIIAHSPCIAHGYDLVHSPEQQKLAVDSGVWPVYRFDPRRGLTGEPPLKIESGPPKVRVADYMKNEGRFRAVELANKQRYQQLVHAQEQFVRERRSWLEQLAGLRLPVPTLQTESEEGGKA